MSTNSHLSDEEAIHDGLSTGIDYINFYAHAVTEQTFKKMIRMDDCKKVPRHLETFYQQKPLGEKPLFQCQLIEQGSTSHETHLS